jgi:hypothetical protein
MQIETIQREVQVVNCFFGLSDTCMSSACSVNSEMLKQVYAGLHAKCLLLLFDLINSELSRYICVKIPNKNFTKIRTVAAQLFRADRQRGSRRTKVTKLTVDVRKVLRCSNIYILNKLLRRVWAGFIGLWMGLKMCSCGHSNEHRVLYKALQHFFVRCAALYS